MDKPVFISNGKKGELAKLPSPLWESSDMPFLSDGEVCTALYYGKKMQRYFIRETSCGYYTQEMYHSYKEITLKKFLRILFEKDTGVPEGIPITSIE